MAEALRHEELTLLAVGPVTNVASLVRRHPDLHSQIEQIVMVAARRPGQSFRTGSQASTPFRDFNFELDPEAMQWLLDTEIPLAFAPWEVSSHVKVTSSDVERLAQASEAGAWLAESVASWLGRWQESFGVDYFNPFDTLAAAYLTHPELIRSFEAGVWIESGEDDTRPGEGAQKPYLLVDPEREGRRAIYTFEPEPKLHEVLMRRLAGP